MTAPARASAWREIDVVLLVLSMTSGVALWAAAAVGAHYATTARQAVTWVDVAVLGLVALGAGNCLWLLRGRRAIRRRLELLALASPPVEDPYGHVEPALDVTSAGASLIRVRGGVLAHRPHCPLVAGKALQPAGSAASDLCQVCST